jgi:hypothetical protein
MALELEPTYNYLDLGPDTNIILGKQVKTKIDWVTLVYPALLPHITNNWCL